MRTRREGEDEGKDKDEDKEEGGEGRSGQTRPDLYIA